MSEVRVPNIHVHWIPSTVQVPSGLDPDLQGNFRRSAPDNPKAALHIEERFVLYDQ